MYIGISLSQTRHSTHEFQRIYLHRNVLYVILLEVVFITREDSILKIIADCVTLYNMLYVFHKSHSQSFMIPWYILGLQNVIR